MTSPSVLDISHHNTVVSFDAIKAAGIEGIIHKAAQGVRYGDEQYSKRRGLACAAGLRWGAYFFATNDDPKQQAAFFLDHAKPDSDTLLALDWETNPDGPTLTVPNAKTFLLELMERTGRSPTGIVIYGGNVLKEAIQLQTDIDFFAQFPLWLCQYGPTAKLPRPWKKYFLWQYSEHGQVSGMGADGNVDLNIYGGDDLGFDWTGKPSPSAPQVIVTHDAPETLMAPSAAPAPTTKELHADAHEHLKENSWFYWARAMILKMLGFGSATGSVGLAAAAQSDPVGTTETLAGFAKSHGLLIFGICLSVVVGLEVWQFVARQNHIGSTS